MPTRTIRLLSAITILALAAAAAPTAAETLVSGETKAVITKLSVDDAFKATPGLFGNLAGEGRAWIDKNKREADQEFRENPGFFADGRVWSFDRNYKLLSAVGPHTSVLRLDYSFMGGAHPNTDVDTILWDSATQKRVSVRPFFVETNDGGPTMTALATLIRAAVAREKKARGVEVAADPANDEWLKAIEPTLLKLGPLALARSTERGKSGGLSVHLPPSAVGPHVEGGYTVLIPWSAFASHLSPEGAAVFGGNPLKDKTGDE